MNATHKETNKLLEAARDLFMRLGIRSVSMDDIARELGVSKKTLYQTVPNKGELVQLVLQLGFEEDVRMLERNRTESSDAIEELLRNSRYFVRQMRQVSPTTMHDLRKYYPEIFHSKVETHQHHFLRQVMDNLHRGKAEGLYREDIDTEVIAHLYVGMTMMVVDRGLFPAQERPLSDILWQHSTYHFFGIVNEAGRHRLREYLRDEELS